MPWFAFGPADELPGDQQQEDRDSEVFDLSVGPEVLEILGNPHAEIRIKCDQPQALLALRLCDVWPDGASTLITRGLLNLSQRNSKTNPEPLIPGQDYTVNIKLNHVGYRVPSGHKLRLAISTSYWPIAWPSPSKTTVSVITGTSKLFLPLRSTDASSGRLTQFESTETGKPVATTQLRDIEQDRTTTIDPDSGIHKLEIYADNGRIRFDDSQLEMDSVNRQRYTIDPDNPLSARAEYQWEWGYSRGEAWQTKTSTHTEITCNESSFFLKAECTAWEQGEIVFSKTWESEYPRDFF